MKKTEKYCTKTHLFELILFVFLPVLVFPVFWTVATLIDWFVGDSDVVLRILYDSKGQLLREFLTDWISSLPFSTSMSWLVVFPVYYLYVYRGLGGKASHFLFIIAAWLALGVWLYRIDMVGLLTMIVTGGLIGGALELLSRLSISCRKLS